jgi:hypothetical protein
MAETVLLIAINVLFYDDETIYGLNWIVKKRGTISPEVASRITRRR